MKTFLMILAVQLVTTAAFATDDCGGCKAVQDAEIAFRSLPKREAPIAVLDQGRAAVQGLKLGKDRRLTQSQVFELVKLVRASLPPRDMLGQVLDTSRLMVRANMPAIKKEANRFDPETAAEVIQAFRISAASDRSD